MTDPIKPVTPVTRGGTMSRAKPIPPAVRQALIDAGKLTPDGLGRAAQLRTCPRCRQWVVVGLDDDRCALVVKCDPVTIDVLGEALTFVSGRSTYELWGKELVRRDAFKITAGMRKPVIPEHECGKPKVADQQVLQLFLPLKKSNHTTGAPPF